VTGGASGGAGAAVTTSSAAASAAARPSAPHASAAVHSATTASGCARLRLHVGLTLADSVKSAPSQARLHCRLPECLSGRPEVGHHSAWSLSITGVRGCPRRPVPDPAHIPQAATLFGMPAERGCAIGGPGV